ncbi:CG7730 [Drosophila busckii]|uniref:CG7730 n=1 Tax=Drosophila busckii TaxID=30019 RepID=A0A0M4F8N8_DROBS|nr:uncharacterized protein LOC108605867 [Drosophila busckii]ALC48407.1 CG7730 [Drosophila busckii]
MTRNAYDVQRDFALSSGLRSEIIWDSLSAEQADVLKQKIENLICETPQSNAKQLEKQREQLYTNVWQQRKYTNGNLLSSIIYVLVCAETDEDAALQSKDYSCHPVIRTRKCLQSNNSNNSEGCCMVFVDEHARVYTSWQRYLKNNALPKGMLIAPKGGVYNGDDDVQLTVQPTPAYGLKQKIIKAGDGLATTAGLMASVPIAASIAVPLAPPLLLAASVVGVGSAAYSTVRAVGRLLDRRWHAQSTSLRDAEARSSWLGVAGGVVSLGASGATKILSTSPNAAAQIAVRGMNVGSLVLNGGSLANGVYELYLKVSDEQLLSSYDVLQLANSLLLFTHSINNLRLANKMTTGGSMRRLVRQHSRKAYERISLASRRAESSSKFDIVRTLNDIPLKETLLGLHQLHGQLAQGASVVGALSATGLLPNFLQLGAGGTLQLQLDSLLQQFGQQFVQQIGHFSSFLDILEAMMRYFSDKALQLLLQLARSFVEQQVDTIDRHLHTFVSTELVLYRLLMHCVKNYEHCAVEFLEQRREEILNVITNHFAALQAAPSSARKYKCPECKGFYTISNL